MASHPLLTRLLCLPGQVPTPAARAAVAVRAAAAVRRRKAGAPAKTTRAAVAAAAAVAATAEVKASLLGAGAPLPRHPSPLLPQPTGVTTGLGKQGPSFHDFCMGRWPKWEPGKGPWRMVG